MKKIFVLLLVAATFFGSVQAQQRVLFIGNSYTYVNNLPTMLQTLAAGCGDQLTVEQSTTGGYWFKNHISDAGTLAKIDDGGWDYVVLQEQSQLPAFPDWQVEMDCLPYATQLCERIRQSSPNAGIAFYMTWGRKNGDATLCYNYAYFCTYLGMDTMLYNSYMLMGEQNHAIVSPVGRVWREIRANYPAIELYNADESHPALAGTYAAAVTFYTILLKKSPECITNNAGVDATAAANIRQIVKDLVYDNLDFWYAFTDEAPTTSISDNYLNINELAIFPNPVSETCTVNFGQLSATISEIQIFDIFGKLVFAERVIDGGVIDVSSLLSGVYVVRAISDSGVVGTGKLIKQQ